MQFSDPRFHPNSFGGARQHKFTQQQKDILNVSLWMQATLNPTTK